MYGARKKTIMILAVMLMVTALLSCGKGSKESSNKIYMYVIDKNAYSVEQREYTYRGGSNYETMKKLISDLQSYRDESFSSPFPPPNILLNMLWKFFLILL